MAHVVTGASGGLDGPTRANASRSDSSWRFGIKTLGLGRYARHLASADSMAWGYNARHSPPMLGHRHRTCANCPVWALRWYERAAARAAVQQPGLWETQP